MCARRTGEKSSYNLQELIASGRQELDLVNESMKERAKSHFNQHIKKMPKVEIKGSTISFEQKLEDGFVYEMAFGKGGTSVDPTGIITYLSPNSTGTNASLYNQTYYKVIDDNSTTNKDTTRNKMEVRHTAGNKFTDIVCTCTLDYGEPTGQSAFDNTTNFNGDFVFDELGLKSWEGTENGSTNKLLNHVIFHPVQKSLNRLIQIDYTLRIQSLTTFTETSSTALTTSNTVSGTTSGSSTGY